MWQSLQENTQENYDADFKEREITQNYAWSNGSKTPLNEISDCEKEGVCG